MDWYKEWASNYGFGPEYHRKIWEYCALSQALRERNFLNKGMSGLCFAAGTEPLPSMFASHGCTILATDLAADKGQSSEWQLTNEFANDLDSLFKPDLIDADMFHERVTFQTADMRDLSQFERNSYDFLWSACALEHLGSLELGMKFVIDAMELLKPGGIAVHTTEINLASLDETIETGGAVIYRQKDLQALDLDLRRNGMALERLDLFPGSEVHDRQFDVPPYQSHGRQHLKLELDGHICTSQLLIAYR